MPSGPLKPCTQPGCPNLTSQRLCAEHRKEANFKYDRARGNARDRGYTTRWDKARAGYLRHHPLCVVCERDEKQTTPATVVDHIVPNRGNSDLFWDKSNWQSLCERHHSRKTAREDGGFGNRVKTAVTLVCGPPGSGK